jgi:uncharacterized protein
MHGTLQVNGSVLVITKGHPFDADAFFALWETIAPGGWTHWEHPDAATKLSVETTQEFDTIVFYDMPGIEFTRSDPPTRFPAPPAHFLDAFAELRNAGKPLVFLHHAIAGWPAWEEYAHIVGGRFHYQPATLNGVSYPDSGYRFDVGHTVEVIDEAHPVCAGLGSSFGLVDELYLFPVFEAEVLPLMRTTFDMTDAQQFYSADLAIRGERNSNRDWTHPAGSQLVAWAKNSRNSPIVYLQFGDGPETYANESFQRALTNAVNWVQTSEARSWAADRFRNGID